MGSPPDARIGCGMMENAYFNLFLMYIKDSRVHNDIIQQFVTKFLAFFGPSALSGRMPVRPKLKQNVLLDETNRIIPASWYTGIPDHAGHG
jgi:hypothetical protein